MHEPLLNRFSWIFSPTVNLEAFNLRDKVATTPAKPPSELSMDIGETKLAATKSVRSSSQEAFVFHSTVKPGPLSPIKEQQSIVLEGKDLNGLGIPFRLDAHITSANVPNDETSFEAAPVIPPLDLRPSFPDSTLRRPSQFGAFPRSQASLKGCPRMTPMVSTASRKHRSTRSYPSSIGRGPPPSRHRSRGSSVATFRSSPSQGGTYITESQNAMLREQVDDATNRKMFAAWNSRKRSQSSGERSRVLFWLGFIAPWCWLIGGWLADKQNSEDNILPIWRNDDKYTNVPPGTPVGDQQANADLAFASVFSPRLDPFVRLCRLAAIGSGILLIVILVVASVLVGRRQH